MAKAVENRAGYEPVAEDRAEQRPPMPAQEQPAPEDVLRELAGRLHETVPGWDQIRAQVVEAARRFQDPTQVRVVLVRSLFRVADLAATDPRYAPQVRWCQELGVAAALMPDQNNTGCGRAAWAVLMYCLRSLNPQTETPVQRLAARSALVAFALALSLATDDLERSDRWLEEAALQCFLIVSDVGARGHADQDFDRFRQAFLQDLEAAAGQPAGTSSLPPWDDGPLGKLWPQGVASGLDLPDLLALRRWADELTKAAERSNLQGMARREAPKTAPVEPRTERLAEALGAFAELTPPRLPVKKLEQVTPENAAEVLAALSAYLDEAGEAVVAVMRLLLLQLEGKSFPTLQMTKDFASKVQELVDRTNHAVECPSCQQLGRYEGAEHRSAVSGAFRVRHGNRSTHGGATVVTHIDLKKLD
jgi:hypothetical protein